jgi:putative ABC transport system substrate-binding protein
MTKKSRTAFLCFRSDNRKSAMFRLSSPRVQNPKWVEILAIALTFVFGGAVVGAQQPTQIQRIGLLSGASPSTNVPRHEAFRQGLGELGYVEGKNIVIEYRYAEGKLDRLPMLAAELVRLNVDIILTAGPGPTRAAKASTSTIPIVMAQDSDPVADGFVASLARPGGNITGLSTFAPELGGKRLEILREVVTKLTRVGVLGNSTLRGNVPVMREMERAAKVFKVQLQYLDVLEPKDIETAFRVASKGRADAVLTLTSSILSTHRAQIIELAVKNRLPVIYHNSQFVEAGGLMSYSANLTDLFHRSATYVDKIIKGRKPAELPVEQATKFEFVINMKTAKLIGLTIPPNVLARADKVIR